jgi:hypothetical protein
MRGVPLPKYRLALLGRFELSRADGPVELPNKKLAALLAYLACTAPEPQSREKLATLLWARISSPRPGRTCARRFSDYAGRWAKMPSSATARKSRSRLGWSIAMWPGARR